MCSADLLLMAVTVSICIIGPTQCSVLMIVSDGHVHRNGIISVCGSHFQFTRHDHYVTGVLLFVSSNLQLVCVHGC